MPITLGFREFKEIRDLIYQKTGIFITEEKIYLLKKRVEKRMSEKRMTNPEEYVRFLKYFDKNGEEFNELINEVTINETYFFREFPQLQVFAEHCLPELIERTNVKFVKILSAGCSSGEEPYTLSIICREMLYPSYQYHIMALDIDDNALKKAAEGIYEERSIKDVPKVYLRKYFQTIERGYRVIDEVRKFVSFYKINLFDDKQLLSFGKDFDFVFCRNVLIYFSDESRRKVVNTFYLMMKPGAYIFLGHSESLSRITTLFELKRMGNGLVYQKPLER
ncbi:CheR family methyltransferase [Pseudothermotoga sp. U03pept]|uniref:CheR family methyltransferase n=1 Tax=Pseudothermotoga sp. U03pept TaxID=3447012 RepID=UPI003F0ABD12